MSLKVISPNGQTAVLSPMGGPWNLLAPNNGYYFGYPWDGTYGGALDLPGDEPGIGHDYCFSMAGSIKIPYAPGILVNSPPGIGTPLQTVPATYLPWDNFDALLGSPLNGIWTIEIENKGLNNNGYLFYWDINFDPSIIPGFTPEFISEEWLPDPSISTVDGNTITIIPTTSGEQCYTYAVTDNFGCTYTETKCITVLEPMELADPEDLFNCGGSFDLTENSAVVLDGADENDYNFQFHHSFQEAIDLANPIDDPQEYLGIDGEQIFMSLEDVNSGLGCVEARSFTLHRNDIIATITSEGNSVCQNETYAFTLMCANGIPPFTFIYTLDGVENSVSTLSDNFVSVPLSTAIIGAHTLQMISVADANCTRPSNDFLTVTVIPLPQSSININDSDPCNTIVTLVGVGGTAPYTFSYFIDSENYTVSSGTATNIVLDLPDTITGQVTIGITSVSDVNCSSSQDDIEVVTINQIPSLPPVADIIKCDSYVLPPLSAGLYYNTEPFGSGAVLPQGTLITATQTIYLIAQAATNLNCFIQTDFTITIIESPQEVADITICGNYTLPNLPDGHSYYDSFGVLLAEGSVITQTQVITIRAENAPVDCNATTTFTVTVHKPVPLLGNGNTIIPFTICEQNTDGFAQFQLNAHLPQILTTEPPENYDNYTVQFFLTQAHAIAASPVLNNLYTNTVQGQQTIWVRVARINTGCVTIAPFDLLVANKAIAYPVLTTHFITCDTDGNNDGLFSFDLTLVEAEVLGSQNSNLYDITYYTLVADAQNGINAIPDPDSYHSKIPYVQQIWVRVENSNTVGGCVAITHFFLYVEKLPEPILQEGKICIDFKTGEVLNTYTLTTGLSTAQHKFTWYKDGAIIPGATGATYEVSQAGSYTVTATTLLGNCVSAPITPVTIETTSPPRPIGIGYTVTNAFVDNQVITVLVEGGGEYQYSLDDGPYQHSNVFTNLSFGLHTVHVKSIADDSACNAFVLDIKNIFILDYPKFFTPNGDGYNDTWGIYGLGGVSVSNIFIFDRFGKLLKQLRAINNSSERWDGTYNGTPVFSNDYWFTIEYMEHGVSKEFRAHFSLKR